MEEISVTHVFFPISYEVEDIKKDFCEQIRGPDHEDLTGIKELEKGTVNMQVTEFPHQH